MTVIMALSRTLQQTWIFRIYKHFIIDSLLVVKNEGIKALARKRGKKFFIIVFGYYLVRDTLLYVLIPFCIARGIL